MKDKIKPLYIILFYVGLILIFMIYMLATLLYIQSEGIVVNSPYFFFKIPILIIPIIFIVPIVVDLIRKINWFPDE